MMQGKPTTVTQGRETRGVLFSQRTPNKKGPVREPPVKRPPIEDPTDKGEPKRKPPPGQGGPPVHEPPPKDRDRIRRFLFHVSGAPLGKNSDLEGSLERGLP